MFVDGFDKVQLAEAQCGLWTLHWTRM